MTTPNPFASSMGSGMGETDPTAGESIFGGAHGGDGSAPPPGGSLPKSKPKPKPKPKPATGAGSPPSSGAPPRPVAVSTAGAQGPAPTSFALRPASTLRSTADVLTSAEPTVPDPALPAERATRIDADRLDELAPSVAQSRGAAAEMGVDATKHRFVGEMMASINASPSFSALLGAPVFADAAGMVEVPSHFAGTIQQLQAKPAAGAGAGATLAFVAGQLPHGTVLVRPPEQLLADAFAEEWLGQTALAGGLKAYVDNGVAPLMRAAGVRLALAGSIVTEATEASKTRKQLRNEITAEVRNSASKRAAESARSVITTARSASNKADSGARIAAEPFASSAPPAP